MKKKNVCGIGGQAVLEGVMMRGKNSMAIAVRNPDGRIVVESERFKTSERRKKVAKIPVLRGIVSFFDSFLSGMKITMRSGEVFGEDATEEPSRFEKWLAKTFKIDVMNVIVTVGAILGILLAVGLFVIVPQIVALAIYSGAGILPVDMGAGVWNAFRTSTKGLSYGWLILYEVIRGVVRLIIFVGYIAAVRLMKDIRRLFMYHGAEHKTISCYEAELPLTVENARTMSTKHDRCGTTFMFIVMVFSILFFTVVPVSKLDVGNGFLTFLVQLVVRVALIPVIAGVSYELLKLFARYDNVFTRVCKAPGLWLQKLTTSEPDDTMLEVAIAAFNEVLALEADPAYPTKKFPNLVSAEKVVNIVRNLLADEKNKDDEEKKCEAELIVMRVSGAKNRTELYDGRGLNKDQIATCRTFARNRLTGAPLQYVLGEACFYGLDFKTDTRALIPRFDTEILAEQTIRVLKENFAGEEKAEVLDLCTGSGCIAVAVKKNADCVMFASDVSKDAISLAQENARRNGAEITFKEGSLFMPFLKKRFDVVVSNPPYIPSDDIKRLDAEVADYEPRLALDGGADGLDFYRDIASQAKKHLKKGGYLLLEVGIGQAERVKELLAEDYEVTTVSDYNTPPVERVVIAKLLAEDEEPAHPPLDLDLK